jgi:hypothetical protein
MMPPSLQPPLHDMSSPYLLPLWERAEEEKLRKARGYCYALAFGYGLLSQHNVLLRFKELSFVILSQSSKFV